MKRDFTFFDLICASVWAGFGSLGAMVMKCGGQDSGIGFVLLFIVAIAVLRFLASYICNKLEIIDITLVFVFAAGMIDGLVIASQNTAGAALGVVVFSVSFLSLLRVVAFYVKD